MVALFLEYLLDLCDFMAFVGQNKLQDEENETNEGTCRLFQHITKADEGT